MSAEAKVVHSPEPSLEPKTFSETTEEMEGKGGGGEQSRAKKKRKKELQGASFTGSGVYGIAPSCHPV